MKIYLARHGETDWNVRLLMQGTTDTELNENGLAQAARLGEAMVGSGITHVYTSYLKRASRTAQIVADCIGVPCEVREGLHELGLGKWEGRIWKNISVEEPEITQQWQVNKRFTRPPQGETYQELLERFIPAIVRIAKESKGDVMVVSHNGSIRAFLAELYGTPMETMGADYPTPNAGAIEVDAAKVLERFG